MTDSAAPPTDPVRPTTTSPPGSRDPTAPVRSERGTRHRGPHPGYIGTAAVGLTAAMVLAPSLVTGQPGYVLPGDVAGATSATYATRAGALRLSGLLAVAVAFPVAIYAAVVSVRLQRLGARVPGPVIALAGGLLAAAGHLLSGLSTWAAAQPLVADQLAAQRAFTLVAFASGGVGFAGPLGLLIAGVVVPSWFLRLLPRWWTAVGMVLAVVALVALLGLVVPGLFVLLPVVRFGGLLWLCGTGFLLPTEVPR